MFKFPILFEVLNSAPVKQVLLSDLTVTGILIFILHILTTVLHDKSLISSTSKKSENSHQQSQILRFLACFHLVYTYYFKRQTWDFNRLHCLFLLTCGVFQTDFSLRDKIFNLLSYSWPEHIL